MPAPITFTLTIEEYEALIALAREGTKDKEGHPTDKARNLDEFLQRIEKENGVKRDAIWVQWQELDAPLPPQTDFPYKWPPSMRWYIELITRKVAKVDVEQVLAARAKNPTSVLVTRDPAGVVGWTQVDQFFR